MPVYDAKCQKCGKVTEYVTSISRCQETPVCCGVSMTKVILQAPMGIVDIPAYVSPVSGKWINSRAERKEDLKRSGSRPWEGLEQEKKEAQRQKAYEEAKQDAKLEEAVQTAWNQLKPEQRKQLETAI